MNRILAIILLFIYDIFISELFSTYQKEDSMGTFKNLDRLLDSFTQGSIPGCACVVMQNHDILYERMPLPCPAAFPTV